MNKGYAVFCDADRYFYDAPHRLSGEGPTSKAPEYPAAGLPVPDGWQSHRTGDWLALRPIRHELPAQGWKIHVTARLTNAESILDRVRTYCLERQIAFKFIPSRYLLHTRNAKYADRAGSGKFITVYPADDHQCETIAHDLDALLRGEDGPYILSDLRWGDGPVFLRYGSFTQRYCYDERGELRPAVADPEGRLVPDLRGPAFQTPDWVRLPTFLQQHQQARAATTTKGLPYTIERALHFSNGGGVYLARDPRTGKQVVLKEARPHAGLAADGADAVTRLHRERSALERLSGSGCTPEVRGHFTIGSHHFLALEHIEGKPLNSFFARRHPLIETEPSAAQLAEYTAWALRIYALVEDAVQAIHARGMVFNDLHLFNIMVTPDESAVVLLDFEAAAHVDEGRRQTVANPAFVAPADRRGFAVDRYALACLRLTLFLPLTTLLAVDRAKARHLAEIIAEQFPVPREFLDEAVREILATGAEGAQEQSSPPSATRYLPVEPADWPRSRDSLIQAVLTSATPEREDRYFPGDIAQFAAEGGGRSFGYGAAGVLYAMAATGGPPCPGGEEWLLEHTKETASGTPLGFYDGLAGVAWTLEHLGHPERALELAELTLARPWHNISPDLHSGLAGLGLALGHLGDALGEPTLNEAAQRCVSLVCRALPEVQRAGLLYGASGGALLLLRQYERTGDTTLLDAAAAALAQDLDHCVHSAGGTLQVNEGWRTMPYLGAGSVGIGMVLDDYLAHRPDERFEQARADIARAAQGTFYAQPSLFRGVAGMVLHLARTTSTGVGAPGEAVARQISALSRHALAYQGHLAFPGEQMMRLSMDLATGTAGCLLALGSAADPDGSAHLPFLPPLRRPQNRF
ncbi:class III lanthionine synthetase LanKC [Streptomyces sp. NPDC006879]|uniref:class III lanthionine synthetase LanKC n=1 Tax=Streptomyces sp. NPDC006879 TaxID=3364767 RepID=UPI003693318E